MKLPTRIAICLIFAAVAWTPFASAESVGASTNAPAASTTAPATGQLTLAKARELTLSRSATLQKAALAVRAASLAATSQGYAALPSLIASAGGAYDLYPVPVVSLGSNPNIATATAQVSVGETIYDGGRVPALVKKFGVATIAAQESLRATRVSFIGQADSAFFAVLEAEASVAAAASDLDAANLRQTIAQAKIDAGSLSKSAYLQTEADTAGYETVLLLAKKTLSSARAKMASLTGLPASTALQQVDFSSYDVLLSKLGSMDETAIDELAASVVAIAKADSPTISGYALTSQQARLALDIAKKGYLPTVQAGLSQNFAYGNVSGIDSGASVSLTATMSLDFWNTANDVDSAAVAASQADLDMSQGGTDLELSVTQALYEWISSAASISSSAKAVDYARSNYENVLEQFKLSSATTSDLSTAEALVSSDETALITARYGFLSNLSTLAGLAGLEDGAKIVGLVR